VGRRAHEHANASQTRPGTSVADTTRLSDVVFPYAGEAIALANGHHTERLAPALRFTRRANHRAGWCMPADNDAILDSHRACRLAKLTARFRASFSGVLPVAASLRGNVRDELDKGK